MAECPYPGIPAYLSERRFPEDRLADAVVTHIWTQDGHESERIAAASLIPAIVDSPEDMMGKVDGLLLARDDSENHPRFAIPFLRAGLPVYIDKPLALSTATAELILAEERYPGQIFTGTAVVWAKEMSLSAEQGARLGTVRHVTGVTPKYWDTYGIHVIEPALQILGEESPPDEVAVIRRGNCHLVSVAWASGASAQFSAMGNLPAPISLTVYGETGECSLIFRDSFSAFRTALRQFCLGVTDRQRMFNLPRTMAATRIIELGRAAR